MISRVELDSRQHPQPKGCDRAVTTIPALSPKPPSMLLQAAMNCVVAYLRQKRWADLGRLRRVLLPSNPGLLLSAINRLIEQGIIVTRSGPVDVIVELASPAREVDR